MCKFATQTDKNKSLSTNSDKKTYMYVLTCMFLHVCSYMYVLTCMILHVCSYMYVLTCMFLHECTFTSYNNLHAHMYTCLHAYAYLFAESTSATFIATAQPCRLHNNKCRHKDIDVKHVILLLVET